MIGGLAQLCPKGQFNIGGTPNCRVCCEHEEDLIVHVSSKKYEVHVSRNIVPGPPKKMKKSLINNTILQMRILSQSKSDS